MTRGTVRVPQETLLRPRAADDVVAVDGKERLNSQGVEIVSAQAVKSGRWLGSERVATDSNEIPAALHLLRRAPAASDAVRFLRCDVGRQHPESPLARNRLQIVLVTPMRNSR